MEICRGNSSTKQMDRKIIYRPFCLPFLNEKKAKRIVVTPVYYCRKCNYMIDYDSQKKISIKQKESNSYILLEGNNLIKKLKIK